MSALPRALSLLCAAASLLAGGCATRSVDVRPAPADAAEFARWSCARIDDELETVQRRAADLAYAVDELGPSSVVALGVGLSVFWPALLAMWPEGLQAQDLARLKGRYEALREASARQGCPPATALSPERAASLPVALGERLVYEDRPQGRRGAASADDKSRRSAAATEWALRVAALRRGEAEYRVEGPAGGVLRHDSAGNVLQAPGGMLQWPRLLRGELAPGQVLAGEMSVSGEPLERARLRGQVVAVGPQVVAGRHFDVAVIELFGDAQHGDGFTRLVGALVVDRASGFLLRLDLRSAQPPFALQRRLVRVEPAP